MSSKGVDALRRWPITVALLVFTCVALSLTWRSLVGQQALGSDVFIDDHPLFWGGEHPKELKCNDKSSALLDLPRDLRFARGLHAGRMEAWSPDIACGAPLWAEQGGPLFPLKLPLYLRPTVLGYNLFRLLRLIAAALGAFLLARQRQLGTLASLAAGLSFELCGSIIGLIPFGTASASYVLPWVILAAHAMGPGNWRRFAALGGLMLGAAGSGGHPGLDLMAFVGFGTVLIARVISHIRQPKVAMAIAAGGAVAVALGLMLSAPTLLPQLELISLGQSYKTSATGDVLWLRHVKELRAALPLGLLAPRYLMDHREQLGAGFPYTFSSTIGLVGLGLALLGMLRRLGQPTLLALLTIGIGLSFAPKGLGWLHSLPGLRYVLPEYAAPVLALALTQWCGDGYQALAERRRWLPLLAFALVLAAVARVVHDDPAVKEIWLSIKVPIFGLLAAILLYPALFWSRLAWLVAPLTLLLGTVESQRTMASYLVDPPSTALKKPVTAAVQFLQRHPGRMIAAPMWIAMPLTPLLYDLPDARQLSALPIKRYAEYVAASRPIGLSPTMFGFRTASPLVDLAAVEYIVGLRGGGAAPPTLEDNERRVLVYADPKVAIYHNLAASPRARVVHKVQMLADEKAAVAWANSIGKDKASATLMDEARIELQGRAPPVVAAPALGTNERANVVAGSDPDRLTIEADLDSAGLVVVADTFYPGWQATVDGTPAAIYPADLLFRAVAVGAGHHVIVMRYRPLWLWAGLLLAALALLCCALLGRSGYGKL